MSTRIRTENKSLRETIWRCQKLFGAIEGLVGLTICEFGRILICMKYALPIISVIFLTNSSFALGESNGGKFQAAIKNLANNRKFIGVETGGITGPGTGITLRNQCDSHVQIESIHHSRDKDDIDCYISSDASSTPYGVYGVHFKFLSGAPACDKLEKSNSALRACGRIRLSPKEAILIFVWGDFTVTGNKGLRITGNVVSDN